MRSTQGPHRQFAWQSQKSLRGRMSNKKNLDRKWGTVCTSVRAIFILGETAIQCLEHYLVNQPSTKPPPLPPDFLLSFLSLTTFPSSMGQGSGYPNGLLDHLRKWVDIFHQVSFQAECFTISGFEKTKKLFFLEMERFKLARPKHRLVWTTSNPSAEGETSEPFVNGVLNSKMHFICIWL